MQALKMYPPYLKMSHLDRMRPRCTFPINRVTDEKTSMLNTCVIYL